MTPVRLMAEAEIARRQAYAPYSEFRVGAALLTADGTVVHGCNVENASLGLSICAERNAIFKAVSQGMREFVAIAVVAEPRHGSSPCGACRQVLFEFAPDLVVYWPDAEGKILRARIEQLLARPFRLTRMPKKAAKKTTQPATRKVARRAGR
jgi:cytidine deaminase